jgi:hypothetical protein
MPRVYVQAKPGRVARVSPQGVYIPHDKFIATPLTPYISRLANHHGDIELSRTDPSKKKTADKPTETK